MYVPPSFRTWQNTMPVWRTGGGSAIGGSGMAEGQGYTGSG